MERSTSAHIVAELALKQSLRGSERRFAQNLLEREKNARSVADRAFQEHLCFEGCLFFFLLFFVFLVVGFLRFVCRAW